MKNTIVYFTLLLSVLLFKMDVYAGKLEEGDLAHLMTVNQKILAGNHFDPHCPAKVLFDSLTRSKISRQGDSVYADLSYSIAISLYKSGVYDATIRYLSEVIPLLKRQLPENAGTSKKLINLSFVLSTSYEVVGLWDQSVDLQYKLLAEALHYKLPTEQAVIYNNLASVMHRQKDYKEAVRTLLKAIGINERLKDKEKLFVNYNNMSAILVKLGEFDRAIEYAFLSIHQMADDSGRDLVVLVQRNIASIYLTINELSLAEKYLKVVEKYQTEHRQNNYLAVTYKILGDLRARQNRPEAAENYYRLALSLDQSSLTDQTEVVKSYAQFCKNRGEINKTYELLEHYIRLKDSISAGDDRKKFSSIAGMYLDEQRLRTQETDQLQDLGHTLARWKWGLGTVVLVFVCILVFLACYHYKQRRRQMERIREQATQLVSLSLEVMHKDEFMSLIADELTKLQQEFEPKNYTQRAVLRTVIASILKQSGEDKKSCFSAMNSSFYKVLLDKYPSLTAKDLRLCVLLRLGLTTKEIADITCKEIRSVESARNRLRRKCELSQEVDLFKFFNRFA